MTDRSDRAGAGPVSIALVFAVLVGTSAAWAEDKPTEAQIIELLKAKRLTRCPQTKCGGVAGENPGIDVEITFAHGSARLGPVARSALAGLGDALRRPDPRSRVVLVAGHTDAKGGESYNQDLSERRAAAVKRFLMREFHLRADRLKAVGFGKTRLKNEANPSADENRRVQVVDTAAQ